VFYISTANPTGTGIACKAVLVRDTSRAINISKDERYRNVEKNRNQRSFIYYYHLLVIIVICSRGWELELDLKAMF
jgi:hypothetical protein